LKLLLNRDSDDEGEECLAAVELHENAAEPSAAIGAIEDSATTHVLVALIGVTVAMMKLPECPLNVPAGKSMR